MLPMQAMSTCPMNGMPSCSQRTSRGTSNPMKRQIEGAISVMASPGLWKWLFTGRFVATQVVLSRADCPP